MLTTNTSWFERALERAFGKRSQGVIDALLKTDELRQVLHRVEEREVEARADLVRRLAAAPARHEKAAKPLNDRQQSARERVKQLENELATAVAELRDADAASLAGSIARDREIADLTRQLLESADPRIEAFKKELVQLHDVIRHTPADSWSEKQWSDRWGRNIERRVYSAARANAAIEALRLGMDRASALALQPLTSDQVTAALRHILHDIALPLRHFQRVTLPEVTAASPAIH